MTQCAVCGCPAKMYCESDQASLCWDCDEKVHCANTISAKHSRSLLCYVCQIPTPWQSSGFKILPVMSICHACVTSKHAICSDNGNRIDSNDNIVDYCDGYDGDDENDKENESSEDQMVPFSVLQKNRPLADSTPLVAEDVAAVVVVVH